LAKVIQRAVTKRQGGTLKRVAKPKKTIPRRRRPAPKKPKRKGARKRR